LLHSLLDIESLDSRGGGARSADRCRQHRRGYEFKLGSPGTTASMRIALADLRLDSLDVIHSGHDSYPLADRIRAVAATRILEDIAPL
jgi:hypothetical protein